MTAKRNALYAPERDRDGEQVSAVSRSCFHNMTAGGLILSGFASGLIGVFYFSQVPCTPAGGRGGHDSTVVSGAPYPSAWGSGTGEAAVHEEPRLHQNEAKDRAYVPGPAGAGQGFLSFCKTRVPLFLYWCSF